jgi:chitinase
VNVGYYQSWAKYRPPGCHPLRASSIPVAAFGYTHLIYSFAGISPGGEVAFYNGVAEEATLYREFVGLKNVHAGLKTLVAVGGWNLDQSRFGRAAATPASRAAFAASAVRFLREHGFDGLDLDWEYPVTRQGAPADRDNYVLLVAAVRAAFAAEGSGHLLTVALPVNPDKLDAGFDLPALARSVDWFHLMSYDVHGAWDAVAGANTDLEYVAAAVEDHILSRGVGGDRLVFGLAAYGRSMVLAEDTCATAGCPIAGAGPAGCAGEAGFSAYFELKEKYVDAGRYDSLLRNERTGSMELVVEGNVFISLDLEVTFEKKREYYLSK